QDDAGAALAGPGHARPRGGGVLDAEPFGLERLRQELPEIALVIDDQDAWSVLGHDGHRGIRIRTCEPRPSVLSTSTLPPSRCASRLTSASPSPVPVARVVKLRSNACARTSGVMPWPLSQTPNSTASSSIVM